MPAEGPSPTPDPRRPRPARSARPPVDESAPPARPRPQPAPAAEAARPERPRADEATGDGPRPRRAARPPAEERPIAAPDDTVAVEAVAVEAAAAPAPPRPARTRRPDGPRDGGRRGSDAAPHAPVLIVEASSLLGDAPGPPVARTSAAEPGPPPARPARAPGPVVPPSSVSVPTRQQRRAAQRLVARKVGRLVRHVDPWSVFKVSLLFNLCLFVVLLVAGTALWALLRTSGLLGGIEGFIEEAFALRSFAFDGAQVFQLATFGGLALVLVGTLVCCLAAVVFNLISDLVGGIRVTVVEEETARPAPVRRPGADGRGWDR